MRIRLLLAGTVAAVVGLVSCLSRSEFSAQDEAVIRAMIDARVTNIRAGDWVKWSTQGDWVCIAILRRLTLAAGERHTGTFVWLTSPFAPGLYSFYATFSAQERHLATQPVSVRLN